MNINIPPGSVVGRPIDAGTGPAQAIPFATLADQLGINNTVASAPAIAAPAAATGDIDSVNYLNVKNFGAVGNGVTDDTAAINSAIAAFNSAGSGQLYFPAGNYLVPNGGLTTIAANGIIFGDGIQRRSTGGTVITQTSSTATLLTISSIGSCTIKDIEFIGAVGASSGSAILQTTNVAISQIVIQDVAAIGFYNAIDVGVASAARLYNIMINNPAHYGIRTRDIVNADAGDVRIINCNVFANSTSPLAGFRAESCGNLALIGCTCTSPASNPARANIGIDVDMSNSTSNIFIDNCSIESFGTYAISVQNTYNVCIANIEIFSDGAGSLAGIFCANVDTSTISNLVILSTGAVINAVDMSNSCNRFNFTNIATKSNVGGPVNLTPGGGAPGTAGLQNGLRFPVTGIGNCATVAGFVPVIAGCRFMVNDSTSTAFNTIITSGLGGGANTVPCFFDGANWRIG